MRRFYLKSAIKREICKEVELQIHKFLDYQPECMHIDSHGHFHTNYSVWKECKYLFLKYGFKSTRLSRNLVDNDGALKKLYKIWYNKEVVKNFEYTTDYFGQFRDYRVFREKGVLDRLSKAGATIELMCHPVFNNEKLENAGSILFSDMLREYSDIKLISY